MADRTVSVRLQALIGPYSAAMAKAARDTREFKQELGKSAREGSQFTKQLGTGMVLASGAMAYGFTKMISAGAGFEKQMAGVRAVSGASADEMKSLSDAALAAGASTKLAGVTASDAAAAEAELVKAGVSVSDVLGGALMGSLTLAAAGQIEFADAATIAAQAMNIFDLAGSDVTHVADVLAAAANKSAGDVGQFGDALRQGGLVAAQTGLSLEETVAALAAFADNALIGSDAGTSLKTMLQRLTPQSKEAAGLMKELDFSAYDAQGNFIGLAELSGELQDALGHMTVEQRNSAMATLFGSDAVRGANVLYEEGVESIKDYITAVDDQGAAARMAAIQNDNLSGDIEALGGAIETVMIQSAGHANGVLREMTQMLTGAVTAVGNLDGPVGGLAVGFGAAVTAASGLGGAVLLLAPKIDQAKKALDGMGTMGQFASRNMGKFAGALGGAAVAVGVGIYAYNEATRAGREYEDMVLELRDALKPTVDGQQDLNQSLSEFLRIKSEGFSGDEMAAMNAFGVTLDDIENSIIRGGDAIEPFRTAVREMGLDLDGVDFGNIDNTADVLLNVADATGISHKALESMIDEIENWDEATQDAARSELEGMVARKELTQAQLDAVPGQYLLITGATNYAAALDDLAPKVPKAKDGIKAIGDAADAATDPVEELEKSIKGVTDALRAQFDPLFAAQDALLDNKDAQRDVKDAEWAVVAAIEARNKAVKEHGKKSQEATEAGVELIDAQRDLEEANRNAVRSALDVAVATTELKAKMDSGGASVSETITTMQGWVDQGLITEDQMQTMATELGIVAEQADILGMKVVNVEVNVNAGKVYAALREAAIAIDTFNSANGTAMSIYRGQGAVPMGAAGVTATAAPGGTSSSTTTDARQYVSNTTINAPAGSVTNGSGVSRELRSSQYLTGTG